MIGKTTKVTSTGKKKIIDSNENKHMGLKNKQN